LCGRSPAADTPDSDFLPPTRVDVIAASGQQNLMANLRFGIRSQIPPVTDPSNAPIDLGLVTAGYWNSRVG